MMVLRGSLRGSFPGRRRSHSRARTVYGAIAAMSVALMPVLIPVLMPLETGTAAPLQRRTCPADFAGLSTALAKDVRGYLTRTYTRLKLNEQVLAVSTPELEPLPLAAGAIASGKSPDPKADPRQLFLTVRQQRSGDRDSYEKSYWLFVAQTRYGWRLSMAFTRIGNAPPQDVSDGAIAAAVRTWFRDYCGQY